MMLNQQVKLLLTKHRAILVRLAITKSWNSNLNKLGVKNSRLLQTLKNNKVKIDKI